MQVAVFKKIHPLFYLAGAAIVLFIPFLGRAHLFDWDEINFAECSREMILSHDYTRVYVDFLPFWEKPPMFFWMQTVAMKIFGISEFAARFPNAVCGLVTFIVLYLCGKKIYDHKFGLYWVLAYGGSFFPGMYFKSGIIDPWFNLFTFLSLFYFILYHWKANGFDKKDLKRSPHFYATISGVFMGLAILTKGQVALMIFLLVLGVYLVYNRFRLFFRWYHALLFLVVAFLVTCTWYGYETLRNGPWFINEFLRYQYRLFTTHDAGQKGFPGYHFVVILFGCFPASVFAISSFFKTSSFSRYDRDFRLWMVYLFWVVTILFSIVQSRIIHYSSLAWFPVTFLAAYTFYKWDSKSAFQKKYTKILLAVIGGIISLAILVLPVLGMNIRKLIPYVKDKFAQANMTANVNWTGWDVLIGVVFLASCLAGLAYLRKNRYILAGIILYAGVAIGVFCATAVFVPKIERYSQGAAIDFCKERVGEDCYVKTLGYKSYAQLFYTRKSKPENENYYNTGWLLSGEIDKPVYFLVKEKNLPRYAGNKELKELYRKNGFAFLKREVPRN